MYIYYHDSKNSLEEKLNIYYTYFLRYNFLYFNIAILFEKYIKS